MPISSTSNQSRFWRDRSPYPGRPSSLFPRRSSDKHIHLSQDVYRHREILWKRIPDSQERGRPTLRAEESVKSPQNSASDSMPAVRDSTTSSQRTDPMDIFEPDPVRSGPAPNIHAEIEHIFGTRTETKLERQRSHPLFGSIDDVVSGDVDQNTAPKSWPTLGPKRSISWAHGCSPAEQKLTRKRASTLPPPSQEPGEEAATPMAATSRPTHLIGPRSDLSGSPPRKWLQLDDNISGPRLIQCIPGPGYDDLPPLLYVTADRGVVDNIPPLDAETQALALSDLKGYVSTSGSSRQSSRSPSPEHEETTTEYESESEDEDQATEVEDSKTESEEVEEEVQDEQRVEPERMVRLLNGKSMPISEWKKKYQPTMGLSWDVKFTVSMAMVLGPLFILYISLYYIVLDNLDWI